MNETSFQLSLNLIQGGSVSWSNVLHVSSEKLKKSSNSGTKNIENRVACLIIQRNTKGLKFTDMVLQIIF